MKILYHVSYDMLNIDIDIKAKNLSQLKYTMD